MSLKERRMRGKGVRNGDFNSHDKIRSVLEDNFFKGH